MRRINYIAVYLQVRYIYIYGETRNKKNDLGKVLRPNYPNGPRGLVFLLYIIIRKRKEKTRLVRNDCHSRIRLIRRSCRTRFTGPIERHFSPNTSTAYYYYIGIRSGGGRQEYIYIYIYLRPQKTNRIVYTNDTYPHILVIPTLIG